VIAVVDQGVDTGRGWYFDAKTGTLLATDGYSYNGTTWCTAVPGFQIPQGCTSGTNGMNLCANIPDAAVESGTDAARD
jgi:hypothetical protein